MTFERIDLQVPVGEDLRAAALAGLTATPPSLPCRFLYDEVGSRLFEAICLTDAYYPTRCERGIIAARAADLATRFAGHALVELGSGSAEKSALVVGEWEGPLHYLPIDIDGSVLDRSAGRLLEGETQLRVTGIAGEYMHGLALAVEVADGPKLVMLLGGNVGNFTRAGAVDFLGGIAEHLSEGDGLLVGVDLRKDRSTLENAYDDPAGVTAAFNRNILVRLAAEADTEVDPRSFDHVAEYDAADGVVRLCLQANRVTSIRFGDQTFRFEAGDRIHTEDSTKYDRGELEDLAAGAGLRLVEHWTDPDEMYSLNLLQR